MDPEVAATMALRVRVVLPDGRELTLEELAANENIVNTTEIRVRVLEDRARELLEQEAKGASKGDEARPKGKGKKRRPPKDVRLEHHLWGEALPDDAVRRKGDVFRVDLFRGRNEIVLHKDGEEEPFSFPLYYRSVPLEWAESLLKALVLVVVVKTFVVQAFFIPTGSMENTLYPSDYILVEKVTTLFERPDRGDVIVFQYPEDPTKDFIKRKVGDEGDVMAMRNKELFFSEECVEEPYVVHKRPETLFPAPGFASRDFWGPIRIPEAHSFALGDNRDNSKDSRFWGALPDYRLKGRALAVYWPLSRWGFIRPRTPSGTGDCLPPLEFDRRIDLGLDLEGRLPMARPDLGPDLSPRPDHE